MEKAIFEHANGTISLTYNADQKTVLIDFSAPCYLTLTEALDFQDFYANYVARAGEHEEQAPVSSAVEPPSPPSPPVEEL